MKVTEKQCLLEMGTHRRTYLSAHELTIDNNGKQQKYWMVTRGPVVMPPEKKLPDAVVIVAIHVHGDMKRLVVTSEFRPAIGKYEIGFPAGLIDNSDYGPTGDPIEAVISAARRELFEETGLEISGTPEVSPINCYSSAGLTDESICFVICKATGDPTAANNEDSEDIVTELISLDEIRRMVETPLPNDVYAKAAWPFMWAFAKWGFPS